MKIGEGLHLGYRRNRTAGTWAVRVVADGSDWTKALGSADDFEGSDEGAVLDYWQAQDSRLLAGAGLKVRALAREGRDGAGRSR